MINSTFISLDGVIESPQHWPAASDVEDETGTVIQTELLLACDAVLMGRRTYDSFAPAWTARSGDPFSDRINSMAKYVVSTTLTEPEWANTTVIGSDLVAEIERLKAEPGKDVVQYGFGRLSYTLLEHGLLDELRLWIHPFFVGRGGPEDLLYRDSRLTRFTHVDTTPLNTGVVILTYAKESP
jgi:dihydrofolate reductase